ncbi:MAG: branched-chain amino acid ABC transporter substrate-binding protein [Pseudomonadales bacterium]|nr:branched-chain amino acid ABC transporter substrate-binding protein [Pseudomonadales bacterium]MCP5358477.1 branched-chain amino acid ABC transporter substrate-binding protein [Pseudomonadales bacterium]
MTRLTRVPGLARAAILHFLFIVAQTGLAQSLAPVRIAIIDPQSGAFAATGETAYLQLQFAADYYYNEHGGILGGRPIEIVALDNKASVADTQQQLRRAISEGIQVVVSGNGSAPASALSQAIERHNRRNPDQRVLFLNYAAVDPALTGADCSFWHFRFDSDSDMKMEVMTQAIAANPDIHRVYIIGQDYSFGTAVAASATAMLAGKRPDIEIVGNELHPIGQVKDFTPYVSKIVASGADAVITGNWGADMVALARSIIDAGLDVPIYTFYGAYDGITATLGEAGKHRIRLVHNDLPNPLTSEEHIAFNRAFKARYPNKDVTQPRIATALKMLVTAMEKTGSTEPFAVATAMEDLRVTNMDGEEVWMRGSDHQAFEDLHVSVQTDEGIVFDADNSGFGLLAELTVPARETVRPSTCQMTRPTQ